MRAMPPPPLDEPLSVMSWAQELLHDMGWTNVTSAPIAGGSQGRVALLQTSPGAPTSERVVLKVARAPQPGRLQREFEALQALHRALESAHDASSPRPLGLHPEGSAYLMTFEDGAPIGSTPLTPETQAQLVDALLHALQLYYEATGDLYGDLQPKNLLVGPAGLCLIDPTLDAEIHHELASTMTHAPASADLGYWLYSVLSTLPRSSVTAPQAALRTASFTRSLLRAAPDRFSAPVETFTREVARGAEVRLDRLARAKPMRGRVIRALAKPMQRRLLPGRRAAA